jgi:hypothetical protein
VIRAPKPTGRRLAASLAKRTFGRPNLSLESFGILCGSGWRPVTDVGAETAVQLCYARKYRPGVDGLFFHTLIGHE